MTDELIIIESKLAHLTTQILNDRFTSKSVVHKIFFREFNSDTSMYWNTDFRSIENLCQNNINDMKQILDLDLQEEAITLKTKERLAQVLESAIKLVEGEI